jgi:drug/metabolite transporter (DMT)-like permease
MGRNRLLATAPLLAAVFWGGMYVVSKWGFTSIPPLSLVFFRVTLGAVVLYAIVRATMPTRSFSRQEWYRFGVLAVWLTATLSTQFLGTDLTNASQGSLLTVLTPAFILLLGVTWLGEEMTRRKGIGIALATAGTLVVLAGQHDLQRVADGDLVGVALLLFSAFGWAVFTVYGKPLVRRYTAIEAVTYSTVLSVPLFAILVPVELAARGLDITELPLTPSIVGAVVYLGVFSTAAAWYCWYKGMEYADASTVAVYFFAQPVVGIALGVALLDETVGPGFLLGSAVLAVGVYLVTVDESR